MPDDLVDQIAAGEVVERPASVVKELVENALDAAARRVRVELRGGGADLVSVTDDGWGMTPHDARLALERHATSKLRTLADLAGIQSFGFRGEALPAIASVSELRLRSRPRGSEHAILLRVSQGHLVEERETPAPEGTRIEVAELFGAVPARRKFLKSATTEWGHVSEWLARAALAVPHVHFDVQRDDRAAISWPAVSDPVDRIAAVLSERDAAALVTATREHDDLSARVYVSSPEAHRATASGIYLFVNQRPVRDRLLRHALLQVYRDVLPRGRFPTALLFLEVADGDVDVNVHPAKWEVRFADPQAVHRIVRAAVGDALQSRGWLGPGAAGDETRAGQGRTGFAGFSPARGGFASGAGMGQGERATASAWPSPGGGEPAGDWLFAETPASSGPEEAADPGSHAPFRFTDLRLIGQLLGTYLMAEDKQGLLLIDQHAAHERVLYERLRASWLEGGVERQGLLTPAILEIEGAARAALLERPEFAERLGFEAEAFGDDTIAVRAVPALLADRDPLGLLRGLADELRTADALGAELEPGTRILESADQLFATMACHAARRAGEVLEPLEQRALLDALDAIPWAPTCPHGRPVAVPMGVSEIERRFGRS